MILKETFNLLKDKYFSHIENLYITKALIGMHMSAMMLSDGSCGIAGTAKGNTFYHGMKSRDYGEFTPTHMEGRRVMELIESSKMSMIVETLRVAALNALSSRIIEGSSYRVVMDADPIDMVDLSKQKRVTVVGAFQSYIQKIAEAGCDLTVLEYSDEELIPEHKKFYVPAADYSKVLPGADLVVITGLTLVNNTIDGLLSAIKPGATVIVTGPSGSILPDVLFRNGVKMIGATRITDSRLLFEVIGQGGAGYHLFKYCARKITILDA
jgi:uncharacterized protein